MHLSVSRDLEITLGRALPPGSRNGPMVRAKVVELPFSRDVAALRIGLDTDGPVGDVDKNARERHGIGARVHDAGDVLSIPVQHEGHLSPLRGGEPPIAVPGSGERVPLLGEAHNREEKTCKFPHGSDVMVSTLRVEIKGGCEAER